MKFIYAFVLLLCPLAQAAPTVFQSSDRQTPLLELYTSEGCSSCPPAEAWLSKLKSDPDLWTGFVPVAFHVDYWNGLGWKDRFSSEQFTERQQNYAQRWSAPNVYTPEFVLNGKDWGNWYGFRGAPTTTSGAKVGVLRASSEDGWHWTASFAPTDGTAADYEVTSALLLSDVSSDVAAGENSGRHLKHDFLALSLTTHPLTSGTNGYQGKFIIDAQPKGITGRLAVAVWVTRAGELEPLQATGGWLTEPEKH